MTLTEKIKQNWVRTAGSAIAGSATAYTLLGALDISRFRNDIWETDPVNTGVAIGGSVLATGLAYALGPKIARVLSTAKYKAKQMGKLGHTALAGMAIGIGALGYINHDSLRLGAWNPVDTAKDIGALLDNHNYVRLRNNHFIDAYLLNSKKDEPTDKLFDRLPQGFELKHAHNRTILHTPHRAISLYDAEMEAYNHPQARPLIHLLSQGDVAHHSYDYFAQKPEHLIFTKNTIINTAVEGLARSTLACNSNYGSLLSVSKMTFTDLSTERPLFGGPLEDIVVPLQGPWNYDEKSGELTIQFYKDGEVRVRSLDGTETTAPRGREHCEKYGYAFEEQLQ